MFMELNKFSRLVMHLNSCSMDLGRDSSALKTYQHEYYKKKSNYLRDVTHLIRDKKHIDICKCCSL